MAEILGKKEGTIKSLLHRAVNKLKETDWTTSQDT
ncbi:MAG: hypothetical protein ACLFVA_05870 [Dehalococcoidia bacterium]